MTEIIWSRFHQWDGKYAGKEERERRSKKSWEHMNKIPDYKRHGIKSKCVAHGDNGQHTKARMPLVEQEIMAGLYSKKVSHT